MDRNTIYDLKMTLKKIYGLFDTIEDMGGKPDGLDMSLRECFQMEVMKVALYFAATDHTIAPEERDFLNELFDYDFSTQAYIELIRKTDVYSTEFENADLLSLALLEEFDKKISGIVDQSSMPVVYNIIEAVAKAMILIDGDVEDIEKEEFNNYFEKLKRKHFKGFVSDSLRKHNSDTSTENSLKDYYLKKKR